MNLSFKVLFSIVIFGFLLYFPEIALSDATQILRQHNFSSNDEAQQFYAEQTNNGKS